ncbi:hypothetical protein COP2_027669 [Malus domestica]
MDSLLQSLQPLQSMTPLLFLLPLIFRFWRRPPYLPGPKGLHLIGNMLRMDQLTHRGLAKLAKQYSGIFHFRMEFLHRVAISNPNVDDKFSKSKTTSPINRV